MILEFGIEYRRVATVVRPLIRLECIRLEYFGQFTFDDTPTAVIGRIESPLVHKLLFHNRESVGK